MRTGSVGQLVTVLAGAGFVAAWSSGFVVAKVATTDASPFTLLLWRFLPLALLLALWFGLRGGLRALAGRDALGQAVVGLLGQFGYCLFVYLSVYRGIATGTTALIDAVQPIVIATLVGPVLGLTVRAPQWLGLAVGATGTGLVVWSQAGGIDTDPLALLLPLMAMACLIAATLLDRRRPVEMPVLTVLTVHALATSIALLVLCAATGTLIPPADPGFWAATALAAAVPSLIAYGLYWYLLRRVGVTVLNGLLFLVAPVTAVAGALMFAEALTPVTWAGFVLCATGVALVLVFEATPRPGDGGSRAGGRPGRGGRARRPGTPKRHRT